MSLQEIALNQNFAHHERCKTRAGARRSLIEYIEVFYNRISKHSALGNASPAQFAQAT